MKNLFLIMVMVGSLVSGVFAVDSGIVVLEKQRIKSDMKKAENLQKDIDELKSFVETVKYSELGDYKKSLLVDVNDKIIDALYRNAIANGKVANIKSKMSSLNDDSIKTESSSVSSSFELEPGDFIVIKFKEEYRESWSWITHNWQHAVIFNTNNMLLNASGPNTNSEKISWSTFTTKYPSYKIEQAILVKFNLAQYKKNDMTSFQNDYLLGKPWFGELIV